MSRGAQSMHLGRVLGVNLRVHYLFLLPLVIWAVTGQLLEGVLAFASVLVHELGHISTASALGYEPKDITLLPFGGVARLGESIGMDPESEIRIALAGPWTSLLVIGAAVTLQGFLPTHSKLLTFLIQVNIMLAVFNLLPALPLDGGRIFRARLVQQHGYKTGTVRAVRISKALGVVFFLLGCALLFFGILNLHLLVLAIFLYIASHHMREQSMYQLLTYLSSKQRELAINGRMQTVPLVVSTDCTGNEVLSLFTPRKYHLFYVIDRHGSLIGILTEQQLLEEMLQHGTEIRIRTLLR